MTTPTAVDNRLLALVSEPVLARLQVEFRKVELTSGLAVEVAGKPVRQAIFIESGILSLLATRGEEGVEVGMVGCEGMTGLPMLFGCDLSSHTIVVQLPGSGLSIPTERLRMLTEQYPDLRHTLLRYGHAQLVQISQSGLAYARSTVISRVARWLLMWVDRAGSLDVPITHAALSRALGVQRPVVTIATHLLEGEGAIRARRGCISVRDRRTLVRLADGSYGEAERTYEQLFPGLPVLSGSIRPAHKDAWFDSALRQEAAAEARLLGWARRIGP